MSYYEVKFAKYNNYTFVRSGIVKISTKIFPKGIQYNLKEFLLFALKRYTHHNFESIEMENHLLKGNILLSTKLPFHSCKKVQGYTTPNKRGYSKFYSYIVFINIREGVNELL